MKRFVIICMALCAGLFFGGRGFCTIPYPSPIGEDDLVEKYSLQGTDRIVLKMRFGENYFEVGQTAFDHTKDIVDKKDIGDILNGMMSISRVEGYYEHEPPGELALYRRGKEIFRAGLSFFENTPVLILNKTRYMCYGRYNISDTIHKYMPDKYRNRPAQPPPNTPKTLH